MMNDLFRTSHEEVLCVDKFIGDDSCAELCSHLSKEEEEGHSPRAKRLVLRGNCLSMRSAQCLSQMLRGNGSLELLSLEWNQLGSSGASFIAHALETNSHLEQIDLKNNGIGDDGAIAFGKSLLKNESLRVLDLRWNQIGDEGASSFEKALLQRKTQLSIMLTGNLVSHKVMECVEKWLLAYKNNHEEIPEEKTAVVMPPQTDDQEKRNKELVKENMELKRQIELLTASSSDMRRQLDGSAIAVTDLEQSLLQEQFKRSQLEEQLSLLRQKLSELSHEYEAACNTWEIQRREIADDHKSAIADMNNEIKSHVTEKESLRDRLRKVKESLESLEVQSDRLQRQSKEEIVELQHELRQATEKASESAVQESKALADAHSAQAGLARANDRVRLLEAEFESYKKHADASRKSEQDSYQAEIEKLQSRLSREMEESSEKMAKINCDMNEMRNRNAEVESEISALKIQMKQSCDEAASLAQKNERNRSEGIIEHLKIRVEELSNERKELAEKNDVIQSELRELQQNHNEELRRSQDSLAVRREECEALRLQVKEMHVHEAKLEDEKRWAVAEMETLRSKCDGMEERESKLRTELQDVSREKDKLTEEIKSKERAYRLKSSRIQEDFSELSAKLSLLLSHELSKSLQETAKLSLNLCFADDYRPKFEQN